MIIIRLILLIKIVKYIYINNTKYANNIYNKIIILFNMEKF